MANEVHHDSNSNIADTKLLPELGPVAEIHARFDERLQLIEGLFDPVLDNCEEIGGVNFQLNLTRTLGSRKDLFCDRQRIYKNKENKSGTIVRTV